jgi:glycerol uptake facilitator-like aquaporin
MNGKILNYLVELIGTYLYVFINIYSNNAIITGISLAGIIILGHLLSFDGHYNPAVTFSMLLDNKLTIIEVIINICLQFFAGYLAYLTYKIIK